MAANVGPKLRQIDRVAFPDHLRFAMVVQGETAARADRRFVISERIGIFAQAARMPQGIAMQFLRWPGSAPPGFESSRFSALLFRSVEGGFDDVREVFSGR